jgi:DNA-binding transcriptional MocR family regulator
MTFPAGQPYHASDAAARDRRSAATKYASAAGLLELRTAIAQWVSGRGLSATPDNVLVTSGTVLDADTLAALAQLVGRKSAPGKPHARGTRVCEALAHRYTSRR